MERDADVVIVGGGIVGCASAYYAARRGARVVLVDKGELGFEQSSRNWGWVHQQVRYPHLIPLAVHSRRLWEGLEKELGAELEWAQGGNLSLAFDERDLEAFAGYRKQAMDAGLESFLLTRDETARLVPSRGSRSSGSGPEPSTSRPTRLRSWVPRADRRGSCWPRASADTALRWDLAPARSWPICWRESGRSSTCIPTAGSASPTVTSRPCHASVRGEPDRGMLAA